MNRRACVVVFLVCAAAIGPAGAAVKKTANKKNTPITEKFEFSGPSNWELVTFQGTRTGRQWGEPVMLVDVQPVRGGRGVTLAVFNTGWKQIQGETYRRAKRATKPEAGPLAGVLKKHKRGDVLAVRVQGVNGVTVLHSTQAYKAKPGEFAPDSAFFVKAEERTRGSGTLTYVTLVKNGKTSVLPLMQTHAKGEKGRMTHTTRADLAAGAGGLSKGDVVEVDVGTDGGYRVIRHIATWDEPYVGQFVSLGQTEIDGIKHVTVQIRSPLGPGELLVQQRSSDGIKYTDDYAMARFVKTLKANQYVAFKTRAQGDRTVMWLIGPTDKTSSTRGAPGGAKGGAKGKKKAPKKPAKKPK